MRFIYGISGILISTSVIAGEVIYSREINRLSINAEIVYFNVLPDMPASCSSFIVATDTNFGNQTYSMLLAAKHAKEKLRRIDFLMPVEPETSCEVTSIAIE